MEQQGYRESSLNKSNQIEKIKRQLYDNEKQKVNQMTRNQQRWNVFRERKQEFIVQYILRK